MASPQDTTPRVKARHRTEISVGLLGPNECLVEVSGQWVVYENVRGGLRFKQWYKQCHHVWPKGRWPYYEE